MFPLSCSIVHTSTFYFVPGSLVELTHILSLKVSSEMSRAIEEARQDQSKSPFWVSMYPPWLNASTFYEAIHVRSESTAKKKKKKLSAGIIKGAIDQSNEERFGT